MRTFAILFLALAATVIGYFVGRANAPESAAAIAASIETPSAVSTQLVIPLPEGRVPTDGRAGLMRALELPVAERGRGVRLAMNDWLAADGAAALLDVRDDPELAEQASRMMQLALFVYPELFLEDPSLLEGFPNAEQLMVRAVSSIAIFDSGIARNLIGTHLAGSTYGDTMLSMVDQTERFNSGPLSIEDAHAELESILAERDRSRRFSRLHRLVSLVAAEDPATAAMLIDRLPKSSAGMAIGPLITAWSKTEPEEAGRWLASMGPVVSQGGLTQLAQQWGQSDFEAAGMFADSLTGARRTAYLTGLAHATRHMPTNETLAWMTRYENDPDYPTLAAGIATSLARRDVTGAMSLIESLPQEARLASYGSVLPIIAMHEPQAAIAAIDRLENESARNGLLPMVASVWAHDDSQSASDWALSLKRGPERDRALAAIAKSVMVFETRRAIDAIDEIEDPEIRASPVRRLLLTMEDEDQAIRIGRDYDLDRDDVLELRASGGSGLNAVRLGMLPSTAPALILHHASTGVD